MTRGSDLYVFVQRKNSSTHGRARMANQWEVILDGKKRFGAYGTRDILIIAQADDLCGPDIEQRLNLELTDADKTRLQRLDIPLEKWHDDVSIMATRCTQDKKYTLLPIERTTPGNLLTKQLVLLKIESYLKTTMKDGCELNPTQLPPQYVLVLLTIHSTVTVHYIGPGK